MNTKQQEKLNAYYNHVYAALDDYRKGNYDSSCNKFRKSAEAFCKFYIYGHYGESDGEDVILGRVDENLIPETGSKLYEADLNTLIGIAKNVIGLGATIVNLLYDIKKCGNPQSHDPNTPITAQQLQKYADDAKKCSYQLSAYLYSHIGQPMPSKLKNAYNGIVDDNILNTISSPIYDDMLEEVDSFSSSYRYMLVSPQNYSNEEKGQLKALSNVPWSAVVDFNPNTKSEGGLFDAFHVEESATSIIINHVDTSIITNGTPKSINWIYANGLSSLTDSVACDIRQWRGKRYNKNLRDIFVKLLTNSITGVYVISLLDDIQWLRAFVNCFDSASEIESDLIHFVIISSDEKFLNAVEDLKTEYPFSISTYNISRNVFLSRLSETYSAISFKNADNAIVPCLSSGKDSTVDVSSIVPRFAADGIDIVHINVANQEEMMEEAIPSFYYGNTIKWEELSESLDATRTKYDELKRKVEDGIRNARKSTCFHLVHRSGAGGTTLSLRLAYDMRKSFPVILIHHYDRKRTMTDINALYGKAKQRILAIVESSEINKNGIEDLVRECNIQKRIVYFVVVERSNKRCRVHNNETEDIDDRMLNNDERNGFLSKAKTYSNNKVAVAELSKRGAKECEVIDFALTIAERNYNFQRISEYIKSYTSKLSEPSLNFLRLVCFVYHYSQKPVSAILFRKEFKSFEGQSIGLEKYLAKHDDDNRCIRKILTQINLDGVPSEYWRPRYSSFAEDALDVLSNNAKQGKWKEMIPELSKSLIDVIHDNNPYLTDDTRELLTSVFLQRGKEDPLGKEEEWNDPANNQQFSLLIQDIGDRPEEQKAVLKHLAESFPDQPHYWGHLARFCYEKATVPEEFDKAMEFIQKAFSVEKNEDYNLQHIAGMCIRRKIEYYKRNEIDLSQFELEELTDEAKGYFEKSRQINNKNIYAYISEIQLLTTVIDYGKGKSKVNDFAQFLLDSKSGWYLEQYDEMADLIEEANILIEQMNALGKTLKVTRSISYLAASETKSMNYFGNYRNSLNSIRTRIGEVDNADKPRLRLLYIKTLLLSKVNRDKEKIMQAWEALADSEIDEIDDLFNKNIRQGGSNIFSLRLWFKFVRYSAVSYDMDTIKSRLRLELDNSEEHPLLKMEAAYYLYILDAFELIRDNGSVNNAKLEEINKYISIVKSISDYDKFSYEFLKNTDGIDGILNHKYRTDDDKLLRVDGIITEIRDNRQGTIEMTNGLTAFFSPSANGFIQGVDETKDVTFLIGFRHDGLYAIDVQRRGAVIDKGEENKALKEENEEIAVDDTSEETEVLADNPVQELPTATSDKTGTEIFKLDSEKKMQKYTILGKIDLSRIRR